MDDGVWTGNIKINVNLTFSGPGNYQYVETFPKSEPIQESKIEYVFPTTTSLGNRSAYPARFNP